MESRTATRASTAVAWLVIALAARFANLRNSSLRAGLAAHARRQAGYLKAHSAP
jgi:hypothetical protein